MKTLLIILALALSNPTLAADKWTGPTSSLDPMWGLSGSSIMTEALRPYPQPDYAREAQIRDMEAELDDLRRKQRNRARDTDYDD